MSEMEGKLIVCNHCGTQIFLKYSGEKNDTVMDGGWTRIKHYSKMPEGWTSWHYDMPPQYKHLCPKCKNLWLNHVETFLKTGVNYGGSNNDTL